MPYVSGMMLLLGGMPEWQAQEPKKENEGMPRWDLDEKIAKHWADKEADGSYMWAGIAVIAVIVAVLVLAAAASGAQAVGYGWIPASDRFAASGEGWSTIEIMLRALAYMVGIPLALALALKAAEVGQDMLSFFWSCFRRRRRKRSTGIYR